MTFSLPQLIFLMCFCFLLFGDISNATQNMNFFFRKFNDFIISK